MKFSWISKLVSKLRVIRVSVREKYLFNLVVFVGLLVVSFMFSIWKFVNNGDIMISIMILSMFVGLFCIFLIELGLIFSIDISISVLFRLINISRFVDLRKVIRFVLYNDWLWLKSVLKLNLYLFVRVCFRLFFFCLGCICFDKIFI